MSRQFNRSMPLGQIMFEQGWTVQMFAAACGVNQRTMTEYLAGRQVMSQEHLTAMATELGVDEREIDFVKKREDDDGDG